MNIKAETITTIQIAAHILRPGSERAKFQQEDLMCQKQKPVEHL